MIGRDMLMREKVEYKKIYKILTCVLLMGVFLYFMGMFLLNTFISPEDLLAQRIESKELAELRLILVKALGRGYGVAQAIYIYGGIVFLGFFYKAKFKIPTQIILRGFLFTDVGILACLMPFLALDENWSADYLYSVYGILSWHCILFAILLLMNWVKKQRE